MQEWNFWAIIPYIIGWTITACIIGLIWFVYAISMYLIKRYLLRSRLPADLMNGLKVGIRLVCIILTFIIFIYMSPWLFIGGIPPEIAVILASIT
ncbi:MAG: hypothetical protein ACTSX4_06740, partial [Candidatus Helarchaeota archaeon]